MNGYEAIKNLIYKQLTSANANIPGLGRNKFAKDLAKKIHEEFMEQQRDYSTPFEFPEELENLFKRLVVGLRLGDLKRNEKAVEVYQWLKEQEDNGKSVEAFIAWANGEEQKRYIPKYYANPEWLKVDFPRAFESTSVKFTKDNDGGLYV